MACKRYTITNNTERIGTYTYQECSELVFDTSEINPGQIKTVWARTETFKYSTFLDLDVVSEDFVPNQQPSVNSLCCRFPTKLPMTGSSVSINGIQVTATGTGPSGSFTTNTSSPVSFGCIGGSNFPPIVNIGDAAGSFTYTLTFGTPIERMTIRVNGLQNYNVVATPNIGLITPGICQSCFLSFAETGTGPFNQATIVPDGTAGAAAVIYLTFTSGINSLTFNGNSDGNAISIDVCELTPCLNFCDIGILNYNPNGGNTLQSNYNYSLNQQINISPYYQPLSNNQSSLQNGFVNTTILRNPAFTMQATAQPFAIYMDTYLNGYCGFFGNTYTRKTYPINRQTVNVTYSLTEETWVGEDPIAQEIVYLSGNTVTAQTGTQMVVSSRFPFKSGMVKVVGQVMTYWTSGGNYKLWTVYRNTNNLYTLVRNAWTLTPPYGTEEFAFNLPSGTFNSTGEIPVGLFLSPSGELRIYTQNNKIYELTESPSPFVTLMQTSNYPFDSSVGWTPTWANQCWTCDEALTPTPTVSNTPTVTPTPSVTPTITPTATSTITPTPTITSTQTSTVTSTPTSTTTPTSTPTSTSNVTPTPTETEVPVTATPTPTITPTCAYSNLSGDPCYHYVALNLSGATQIRFDLCGDSGTTSPRTFTASTYPSTVLFGPLSEADCLVYESYEVTSGSTPISLNYFNECCEPVTPCDGCLEYDIFGGVGSGSTWSVNYCSGGTETINVSGYSSRRVCLTSAPLYISGVTGLDGTIYGYYVVVDCCGTPVTPTPTPTTSELPVTPTPTETEVPVTPTPTPTVTCVLDQCYVWVEVELTGSTQIQLTFCGGGLYTRVLTASTYPDTVRVRFETCFEKDSLVVLSGSTPVSVTYDTDCCINVTPTPTETEVPVTPTPTSSEVPVTPTPTSSEVPVTPTPTSSEVPVTPSPTPTITPTCEFGNCYQYVYVQLTGATEIEFDLCGSLIPGVTYSLSSATYPDTAILGPNFGEDCFLYNSYRVISGATPFGVVFSGDCCSVVSPTPTPTETEVPVTPSPTSSEVPVTPTSTPTGTTDVTPTPTSSEIPVTPTPTSTPTGTTDVTPTPTSSEIPVTPTPTSTPTGTTDVTPTPTSSEIPVTPTPTSTPCSCNEWDAIATTDEGGSVEYIDCNGNSATVDVRPFSIVTFCACSVVNTTGSVEINELRECKPVTPTPTNTPTLTQTPTSSPLDSVTPTPTLTPSSTGCEPFSGGTITNTVLDSPDYSIGWVQMGYIDGGVNIPGAVAIKGSQQLPVTNGSLSVGTVCETDGYVYVYADTFGNNPVGTATVITVNLNGSFLGQVQGPFQGSAQPPVTNTFTYTRNVGDSIEILWDSVTSGSTPTPTVTTTPTGTPEATPTPTGSEPPVTPTPTSTVTPTQTEGLTPTPTETPAVTSTPTNTSTPEVTPTPSSTPPCPCTTWTLENTGPGSASYSYTTCSGSSSSGTLEGFQSVDVCACSVGPLDPSIEATDSGIECAVEGYSFNLVALPYDFPSSGNTIMNNNPLTSGSTNPNLLDTSVRGIYWNSIDSDGIDRTSYFSSFTGQSITITMSQTGSTAIYSGDTNSLKQWDTTGDTGFVFGTMIGVPPVGTPSGNAVLIQSASTEWTIGFPVYISVVINTPVTPTPTPTNTVTPTVTPSSSFVSYEFREVGYEADPSASCSLSGETIYSNRPWNGLSNGNVLYSDISLTTPVPSGWYSYTDGDVRTSFETNDSGVIITGPSLCP